MSDPISTTVKIGDALAAWGDFAGSTRDFLNRAASSPLDNIGDFASLAGAVMTPASFFAEKLSLSSAGTFGLGAAGFGANALGFAADYAKFVDALAKQNNSRDQALEGSMPFSVELDAKIQCSSGVL